MADETGNGPSWKKQFTIVTVTVLPCEGMRPVTMSKEMCDHGRPGTETGCRLPADGVFEICTGMVSFTDVVRVSDLQNWPGEHLVD